MPAFEIPVAGASLIFKVLVTVWLLAVAASNVHAHTIPNRLTLPALALFGGGRVVLAFLYLIRSRAAAWVEALTANGQALPALRFMLLAWAACVALWELHVIGGGDSKLLMGLLALFPNVDFVLLLAVSVLCLRIPLLVFAARDKRPREITTGLTRWLKEGGFIPTQRRLEEEGQRYAWVFCIPGAVFLWFLW